MRETIKLLGEELRKVYASMLTRRLPWHMVDTLAKIEEAEEDNEKKKELPE